MKVEVKFGTPQKPKFEPQLMKLDGDSTLVVLQTSTSKNNNCFSGVVIVEGNAFTNGTYKSDWITCNFKPFTGTITLTQ